jgi:hypothetical protein
MAITEHGYVIQWADKQPLASTFATNRQESWTRVCGDDLSLRASWKKSGARCVPATRTISVEEE